MASTKREPHGLNKEGASWPRRRGSLMASTKREPHGLDEEGASWPRRRGSLMASTKREPHGLNEEGRCSRFSIEHIHGLTMATCLSCAYMRLRALLGHMHVYTCCLYIRMRLQSQTICVHCSEWASAYMCTTRTYVYIHLYRHIHV